jgi:hypothetical protein
VVEQLIRNEQVVSSNLMRGSIFSALPKWWNWYTCTSQKRVARALQVRVCLRHFITHQNAFLRRFGAFFFVGLVYLCNDNGTIEPYWSVFFRPYLNLVLNLV